MQRAAAHVIALFSCLAISQPSAGEYFPLPSHGASKQDITASVFCHLSSERSQTSTLHVVQVNRSSDGATVKVRLHTQAAPIVILVSSISPINWHFSNAKMANIQQVVIVGRHARVSGLASGTPVSHCRTERESQAYSGFVIDQVADALAVSVESVQRQWILHKSGFDIRPKPYPSVESSEWDRCRLDADFGGLNITRDKSTDLEACRKIYDETGVLDRGAGRAVCVYEGKRIKAYPARPGYELRQCRLIARDGRNIISISLTPLPECRRHVCSTGKMYISSGVKNHWSSQCLYTGDVIERFRFRKENLPQWAQ